MNTRGAVLARPLNAPAAPSLPPALIPGSRNNLRARQVTIFGTGNSTGLFVYTGTPALGNPPQVAIVPSSTTQDPVGNAITTAKILIQANVITETSGAFRTAANAPLIQLDGAHNAEWIYSTGITMIAALAAAAGNDGLGNNYPAGITSFVTVGGAKWAVNLGSSVTVAGALGTLAALALQNQTTPFNQPPSIAGHGDGSSGAELVVSSGKAAAAGTQSGIFLLDSLASGLVDGLITMIADQLQVSAADGNVYNATGRLTQIVTPTPQTINNTAGQGVNGISFPVESNATYELEAFLFCTVGPNALVSAVAVTGPATSFASFKVEGTDTKHGSLATALGGGNQVVMGTLTNYVNNGTIPVGDTFVVKIAGRFVTSAAGSVGLLANTSVAANTYTINNGSYAILKRSS